MANIKALRTQVNGIVANVNAEYAKFPRGTTFGNDYTLISDRFLSLERRKDGSLVTLSIACWNGRGLENLGI